MKNILSLISLIILVLVIRINGYLFYHHQQTTRKNQKNFILSRLLLSLSSEYKKEKSKSIVYMNMKSYESNHMKTNDTVKGFIEYFDIFSQNFLNFIS